MLPAPEAGHFQTGGVYKTMKRHEILTIPNLLSLMRLGLIPVFLWLYCVKGSYVWAVATLVLSGLSDILDGRIARRFNMVSDLGKILDPAADKLTQMALILCLILRYKAILALLSLFVVKELTMGILGLLVVLKTKNVPSSRWFGKACTAVLEISMAILILFPMIPETAANILILLSGCMLAFAFAQYVIFDIHLLREGRKLEDV